MFKSERIACYLNTFAGYGDDNENKELKLVFHVSPITAELASEISPQLADRLFRYSEDRWQPAQEITKASFFSIIIPMQNIRFHGLPLPEAELAEISVMVPGAVIGNLRAQRVHPEGPNFRLEFDVVVPMDGITMRLVEQYYKSTCFLTMEPVQREIEYAPTDQPAADNSLQEAADAEPDIPAPKRGRKKKAATPAETPAEAETEEPVAVN